MKKNLFYLFALVCSLSLFSSCSDDDGDNVAGEVAGSYIGTMSVEAPTGDESADNQTVTINRKSDDQVSIGIASLNIMGQAVNNVSVDCAVSKNGSKYTLSGTGTVLLFPVTVSGTVNGKVLDLSITVTTPSVNVTFSGTKQ